MAFDRGDTPAGFRADIRLGEAVLFLDLEGTLAVLETTPDAVGPESAPTTLLLEARGRLADRLVIIIDPMLATANTAVAAIDRLKERGVTNLRFVCLVASPEGLERLKAHHPEVPVWTAAIDERLNEHGYIVPGLGDAGDRLYGTR